MNHQSSHLVDNGLYQLPEEEEIVFEFNPFPSCAVTVCCSDWVYSCKPPYYCDTMMMRAYQMYPRHHF